MYRCKEGKTIHDISLLWIEHQDFLIFIFIPFKLVIYFAFYHFINLIRMNSCHSLTLHLLIPLTELTFENNFVSYHMEKLADELDTRYMQNHGTCNLVNHGKELYLLWKQKMQPNGNKNTHKVQKIYCNI